MHDRVRAHRSAAAGGVVRTYVAVAVARRARAYVAGSGHRAGSGGDRDGHFVVAALARTL